MSTKVCVTSARPEWKDSVTLGQLQNMMVALNEMGYDQDTPVTYLHDHDHVWLETVHDVDDDFDIEVVPVPRVVDSLGKDERHAYWVDKDGHQWRWAGVKGWQWCRKGRDYWINGSPETIAASGPYTEDLSS